MPEPADEEKKGIREKERKRGEKGPWSIETASNRVVRFLSKAENGQIGAAIAQTDEATSVMPRCTVVCRVVRMISSARHDTKYPGAATSREKGAAVNSRASNRVVRFLVKGEEQDRLEPQSPPRTKWLAVDNRSWREIMPANA
jgi:hypothetical protein